MTRIGKVWTDAVAYVALAIGAGLSIAGNVADTYRTRGHDTDVLDIVMAVAWPALVILMVEIFVSTRWTGLDWPMQVLRWTGTLAIGGMAMRVSWVHLNDLMASRGQKADVSVLGPLAIDALAIMATALILAGRVANDKAQPEPSRWHMLAPPAEPEMANAYATIDQEAEDYLRRLSLELDSTITPAVPVSVNAAGLPQRRRGSSLTPQQIQEAQELARVGKAHGLPAGDVTALLAGWYGVSTRTIYRAVN